MCLVHEAQVFGSNNAPQTTMLRYAKLLFSCSPVFLCDLCHCDVEWLTTSVQQVGPSSSQVNVCAVVNEWVAFSHIAL